MIFSIDTKKVALVRKISSFEEFNKLLLFENQICIKNGKNI